MPNPYTVQLDTQPLVRGLAGLGAGLGAYQSNIELKEKRAADLEKQNAANASIQAAMQSGDIRQIQNSMIKYPKLAKGIESAVGFGNEQTKQNGIDTALSVLSGDTTAIERRKQYLQNSGLPTERTDKWLAGTPEEQVNDAKILLAGLAPDKLKAFQSVSGGGEVNIGAQEILENGTIIQSTRKGPRVYDPTGKLVTGQAAADAIKIARAEKVSNLRKAAGQKKTATLEAERELKGEVEAGVVSQKAAASASVDAFNKLKTIESAISNIGEAINLIDQGAETGAIASLLPSVKAASVKLDNLQGRLGLDVISNTTFGALSGPEMAFALDTALPKKLEGPDLKDWLIEKKNAQEKLADYLEGAAIYLGTPGNTHASFLKSKRMKKKANGGQSSGAGSEPAGAAIGATAGEPAVAPAGTPINQPELSPSALKYLGGQ